MHPVRQEPAHMKNAQQPDEGEPTRPASPFVERLHDIGNELLTTILPAVILALLLTHFVAQGTLVYGQSMEPNLHDDQRIIVEKISHKLQGLERGDIVIINVDHAEIPLIKRIVGLPGETVEIKAGQVYIDGQALGEPYLPVTSGQNYGPTEVPPAHVFVLGDNRAASNDSRYFGAVPVERIIGKAWFSLWPPRYIGRIK